VQPVRYHHRLCNGQTARGTHLNSGHGKHGAVAAAPSYERPTADAVVARGAHLLLKVRCAVMNGTLEHEHTVAETRARRPFRRAS
jgi:hypothetical protein